MIDKNRFVSDDEDEADALTKAFENAEEMTEEDKKTSDSYQRPRIKSRRKKKI